MFFDSVYQRAPQKGVTYPGYPELKLESPPRAWMRCRIIIDCFDEEQLERLSEKVAEFCGHTAEAFVHYTDDDGGQSLGEAVLARKVVPVNALMALEEVAE
jgi:hypothetical protein